MIIVQMSELVLTQIIYLHFYNSAVPRVMFEMEYMCACVYLVSKRQPYLSCDLQSSCPLQG